MEEREKNVGCTILHRREGEAVNKANLLVLCNLRTSEKCLTALTFAVSTLEPNMYLTEQQNGQG
jgi:hypothetical protein